MKAVELRFSDTNSANDSSGKTWGLEGGLFWVMVAGGSFSLARGRKNRTLPCGD